MRSSSASSPVSCGGLGAAGQFDRAFRPADAAFAVGDQRAAARTCCPSGGRPAVRRAPAPSRRSGRRRCRRPRGPRRCARSGCGPPGRAPAPPRDRRRAVHRPRPDAGRRSRRCCDPAWSVRRGSRAPAAWRRCPAGWPARAARSNRRSASGCAAAVPGRARPGPDRAGAPSRRLRCPPPVSRRPPRPSPALIALPVVDHCALRRRTPA